MLTKDLKSGLMVQKGNKGMPGLRQLLVGVLFYAGVVPCAFAATLEWSSKTVQSGTAISGSGYYQATAGTYRLHSAAGPTSTVLNSTAGTNRLTSQYLQSFPPRALAQCRNLDPANCTTWQNDQTVNFRNDRGCGGGNCAFSKGALHYYRAKWSTNATESDAVMDAADKWSDIDAYCPSGSCNKLGTTVSHTGYGESANWYLHVRSYNGGLIGDYATYGPFGFEWTLPSTAFNAPGSADWVPANFAVNIGDVDNGSVQSGFGTCEVRVLSNSVETKAWGAPFRTCNSSSSYTVTVGSGQQCQDIGANKCEVQVRATDQAGNLGNTASRTFSVNWNIAYVNSSVNGDFVGYPANAYDGGGAYLGTLIGGTDGSGNPRLHLMNQGNGDKTITILDTQDFLAADCGGSPCGALVDEPRVRNESGSTYVYAAVTNGYLFKFLLSGSTLSTVAGWPIAIPNKCGAATRNITSGPMADDKLVYIGAKDPDCATPNSKQYFFAYEINPTAYDADQGSDGIPDKIVDVAGCDAGVGGTTVDSTPKITGTWSVDKFMHVGSDCPTREVFRINVDANNVSCYRDLVGSSAVTAAITGSTSIYFGTSAGTYRFHALTNFGSTSACNDPPGPSDPYADLTGFPFAPVELDNAVTQTATVHYSSNVDEIYFTDNESRLYCVCQTTSVNCSPDGDTNDAGETCGTAGGQFPVGPLSGNLSWPIIYNGTIYTVSTTGYVYAHETFYDPAGDAVDPGTQVGAAQGYPYNFSFASTSSMAIRNTGTDQKLAIATNDGTLFYLPLVP